MISGLTTLLKYFQSERHRNEPHFDEALKLLLDAIRQTTVYLDSHYDVDDRVQEKEFELCRLWEESALALRRLDRDLAERCLLKGDLWAGGGEMIEVKENRIRIEDLRKDFQRLFESKN